jgi:hypothetical protein
MMVVFVLRVLVEELIIPNNIRVRMGMKKEFVANPCSSFSLRDTKKVSTTHHTSHRPVRKCLFRRGKNYIAELLLCRCNSSTTGITLVEKNSRYSVVFLRLIVFRGALITDLTVMHIVFVMQGRGFAWSTSTSKPDE